MFFIVFFFSYYGYHRDLHVLTHSVPTRRSSDLGSAYCDVIADTGAGNEGVAYGLFTASAKLSLAISAAGIGLLLEDTSFREVTSSRLQIGRASCRERVCQYV